MTIGDVVEPLARLWLKVDSDAAVSRRRRLLLSGSLGGRYIAVADWTLKRWEPLRNYFKFGGL